MRTILSLLLLFLGFSTIAVAQNQYYYYFEEKIELVPSESKFILHFASQDEPNQNIARISNNNLFKTAKVEPSPFRSYVILETKEKNMGKAEVLKSLASLSNNVKSISSVYVRVKGGDELLLTHKVLFGPKTPSDLLKIKAILKNKISVDDIKEELGIFSFVVKDEQQVFELANLLQESGYVEYAQPDFYGKPIQFNDPLFENQFYLHNTGQTVTGAECKEDVDIDAPEAWEITKGSSDIRVAIVDDGLVPHEEFIRGNGSSKWVDGFTPLPNDDFPQIPTDGTIWPLVPTPINGQVFQPDVVPHGLACAGLIGASHNDTGIKGIAPEASLLSVNIFIATTEEIIARGLNWSVSENVDVISNSWGFPRPSAVITSAIRNAVNNGRNGKGCVVVFAVGNESGARIGGGKKPVSYPASLDDVN